MKFLMSVFKVIESYRHKKQQLIGHKKKLNFNLNDAFQRYQQSQGHDSTDLTFGQWYLCTEPTKHTIPAYIILQKIINLVHLQNKVNNKGAYCILVLIVNLSQITRLFFGLSFLNQSEIFVFVVIVLSTSNLLCVKYMDRENFGCFTEFKSRATISRSINLSLFGFNHFRENKNMYIFNFQLSFLSLQLQF